MSLVVLCLLGGDQSALGFVVPKRSGERGRFSISHPPSLSIVCGRQPAVEAQDRVEAGEAGPVSRRDLWVGVWLCESAGRVGTGPSGG